jgi:hypothetical protein
MIERLTIKFVIALGLDSESHMKTTSTISKTILNWRDQQNFKHIFSTAVYTFNEDLVSLIIKNYGPKLLNIFSIEEYCNLLLNCIVNNRINISKILIENKKSLQQKVTTAAEKKREIEPHFALITQSIIGHQYELTKLLVENKFNLDSKNQRNGDNLIHYALDCRNQHALDILLEQPELRKSIIEQNFQGYTPLHYSIECSKEVQSILRKAIKEKHSLAKALKVTNKSGDNYYQISKNYEKNKTKVDLNKSQFLAQHKPLEPDILVSHIKSLPFQYLLENNFKNRNKLVQKLKVSTNIILGSNKYQLHKGDVGALVVNIMTLVELNVDMEFDKILLKFLPKIVEIDLLKKCVQLFHAKINLTPNVDWSDFDSELSFDEQKAKLINICYQKAVTIFISQGDHSTANIYANYSLDLLNSHLFLSTDLNKHISFYNLGCSKIHQDPKLALEHFNEALEFLPGDRETIEQKLICLALLKDYVQLKNTINNIADSLLQRLMRSIYDSSVELDVTEQELINAGLQSELGNLKCAQLSSDIHNSIIQTTIEERENYLLELTTANPSYFNRLLYHYIAEKNYSGGYDLISKYLAKYPAILTNYYILITYNLYIICETYGDTKKANIFFQLLNKHKNIPTCEVEYQEAKLFKVCHLVEQKAYSEAKKALNEQDENLTINKEVETPVAINENSKIVATDSSKIEILLDILERSTKETNSNYPNLVLETYTENNSVIKETDLDHSNPETDNESTVNDIEYTDDIGIEIQNGRIYDPKVIQDYFTKLKLIVSKPKKMNPKEHIDSWIIDGIKYSTGYGKTVKHVVSIAGKKDFYSYLDLDQMENPDPILESKFLKAQAKGLALTATSNGFKFNGNRFIELKIKGDPRFCTVDIYENSEGKFLVMLNHYVSKHITMSSKYGKAKLDFHSCPGGRDDSSQVSAYELNNEDTVLTLHEESTYDISCNNGHHENNTIDHVELLGG